MCRRGRGGWASEKRVSIRRDKWVDGVEERVADGACGQIGMWVEGKGVTDLIYVRTRGEGRGNLLQLQSKN